jgi:ribosomal protein S18 acetylase RimI-like enzyme
MMQLGVLELAAGMSPEALAAVAALEARTVAADGGRLKLEWGVLRSRSGERQEDLLWWDGDTLLGFLGIYTFGFPNAELAGMVDPSARRQGIATTLLDAALRLCRDRNFERALLVTPRGSTPGRLFSMNRGASLDHSEYAMALVGPPTQGPSDPRIELRRAAIADANDVARFLLVGFGHDRPIDPTRYESGAQPTLMVLFDGRTVGTVRVSLDGDQGGVYGFVIDPEWQGRGIGRDVLRRVCARLRDDGARRIGLEVLVDNERALGLYTSIGFVEVTTEDYYALAI